MNLYHRQLAKAIHGFSTIPLVWPFFHRFTEAENEIMKGHVNHGIDIVKRSDWLKDAHDVVGYHHDRIDGKGYPYGFNGETIFINARIFTIADVFDALTSMRPYQSPMPFDQAMGIIEQGRGSLFDPVPIGYLHDHFKVAI